MNSDRQHKEKTHCHKLIIKLLLYTSLLNQKQVTTLQSDCFAFLLRTVNLVCPMRCAIPVWLYLLNCSQAAATVVLTFRDILEQISGFSRIRAGWEWNVPFTALNYQTQKSQAAIIFNPWHRKPHFQFLLKVLLLAVIPEMSLANDSGLPTWSCFLFFSKIIIFQSPVRK